MDTSEPNSGTYPSPVDQSLEEFVAEEVPAVENVEIEEKKPNEHRALYVFIGVFLTLIITLLILTLLHGGGPRINFLRSRQLAKELKEVDPNLSQTSIDRTMLEANEAILADIAEIQNEGGLPEQVFRREVDPKHNLASQLRKEFQDFPSRTYETMREKAFSTGGNWSIDPASLQGLQSQIEAVTPQRDRIREMLDQKDVSFEQEFVTANDVLVPDEGNIDSVRVYLLLEELEVAKSLENRDMAAAMKSILYMLRLVEMLAQSKFLDARIEAAFHRESVLYILQTLVLDPDFGRAEAQTLILVFRDQLLKWPPDSRVWISERAACLRDYDLIRRGKISEALHDDEIQELQNLNVFGVENDPAKKGGSLIGKVAYYKKADVDRDQEQYLKMMREILESCTKPFYARIETLNRISDQIYARKGTKEYLALATIFLRGIRSGMQRQAEDRARVDAWYLALASALDRPIKEGALDPVLGAPYYITRTTVEGQPRVIVRYSNEKKVEVQSDLR